MHKGVLAFLLLLLAALAFQPAAAREEMAKETCFGKHVAPTDRIVACTRYLRGGQPGAADQVAALLKRGYAFVDQERFAEAIADFEAAMAVDPASAEPYKGRGLAYERQGDAEAALADYDRAIVLAPEDPWAYSARAFALIDLGRLEEALAAFDEALLRDPDKAYVLEARARLHLKRKDHAAALADLTELIALKPYRAYSYMRRARVLLQIGSTEAAVADYRLALLLDPNELRAEIALERLGISLASALPLEARDVAFAPPAVGLAIEYLDMEISPEAERDDMLAAIEALVGFFVPELKPMPLALLLVTRRVERFEGRDAWLAIELTHPALDDVDEIRDDAIGYLDGIWPSVLRVTKGSAPTIRHDLEALAGVWQLAAGEQRSGGGDIVVICPAGGNVADPLAALVGCQPGLVQPMGHIAWTVTAEGWEELLLPAGNLPALRLRYEELSEITLLGQSKTRTAVTTWWWSPDFGWWVKRRHERDGRIEVSVALRRLP